jgi:hypothetical protein
VISLRSLFRGAIRISADPDVGRPPDRQPAHWARSEVARHDVRHLLEAGAEIGRYNAVPWLKEIDVPTSVLVTDERPRDPALAPARARQGDSRRARAQDLGRPPLVRVSRVRQQGARGGGQRREEGSRARLSKPRASSRRRAKSIGRVVALRA